MRTVDQVIAALPRPAGSPLPAPSYRQSSPIGFYPPYRDRPRIGLAVASMARHTTDEGWQLFQGLHEADYHLAGSGLPEYGGTMHRDERGRIKINETNVNNLLVYFDPSVVVVQDKREWLGLTAGGQRGFDHRECFTSVEALRERDDVFKVAVLKDAHRDSDLQRESAEEMGAHAWIVYYNPRIVAHLAPHVRPEHLIRTWHSLDAGLVPPFSAEDRSGCLISGALGGAYPLRTRLVRAATRQRSEASLVLGGDPRRMYKELPGVDVLPHPGYHRNGCATPEYLKTLSRYRVAICTSSVYGYALRKIVEATACGCAVITDLPVGEEMPFLGGNLLRIESDSPTTEVAELVRLSVEKWDPDRQFMFASEAKRFYDYRAIGRRLADDVEAMRRSYVPNLRDQR